MQLIISTDFEEMSGTAWEDFLFTLEKISKPLICLPSGKTPLIFLRNMRNHFSRHQNHPDWYFIGLDEWVGIGKDVKGSCRQFFDEHLFIPLGISEERISFFNGIAEDLQAECQKAERFIDAHKGIDLTVLGIGTNGHLGLNEPGSDPSLRTQIKPLSESTIKAARDYFDEPMDVNQGITLGLKTLLESKTVFLMAGGEAKAAIIKTVVEGSVTKDVPGSFLQEHLNCFVYLDEEAA
ncbi:MAG: glucosamine-6-phosphate deaminase, partial [Chitinophagaceae bacterium]